MTKNGQSKIHLIAKKNQPQMTQIFTNDDMSLAISYNYELTITLKTTILQEKMYS